MKNQQAQVKVSFGQTLKLPMFGKVRIKPNYQTGKLEEYRKGGLYLTYPANKTILDMADRKELTFLDYQALQAN